MADNPEKTPKPGKASGGAAKGAEKDEFAGIFEIGESEKKVRQVSLLIALCVCLASLFVVFPEFVTQLKSRDEQVVELDVPKQVPVRQEQRQEEKVQTQQRNEQRQNEFSDLPSLSRPTGDQQIIADRVDEQLEVTDEGLDDLEFFDVPDEAPGPVEVAGDIQRPVVRFQGAQPYPQRARILRRNGSVRLRVIVYKNGTYEILQVMEERPAGFGFAEAARTYMEQSVWQPATLNGRPIDVYWDFTINFTLNR